MARPSTIHRFIADISDLDRGVYESLDLRVARHPSETVPFLLTRLLALVLEHQEGLEFTRGLCAADEPAVWVRDLTGHPTLWIDIGAPSPDRLHKASKAADEVVIYSHKAIEPLLASYRSARIHRSEHLRIEAVPTDLLNWLEARLARTITWGILRTEGVLYLTVGEETFESQIKSVRLAD